MGRKVFQDFAHVLCQKFLEVPSTRDLVNLALFGDGVLDMNFVTRYTTHNRLPVEPLPFMDIARDWLDVRLSELTLPKAELVGASLTVEYTVALSRRAHMPGMSALYNFTCTGVVEAIDRSYSAMLQAEKTWGLLSV